MELENFKYNLQKGPLSQIELEKPIKEGNCRLAVQYYLFKKHGYYLPSEDAICPVLYEETGRHISIPQVGYFAKNLYKGDIILAQRIRDKNGLPVNRSPKHFGTKQDWIIALHSAIYLGSQVKKPIWHATSVEGKTCYWSIEKFQIYYKPVAVKRINFEN